MDRRRFLLTALSGAFSSARAAEAQQIAKVHRIGYLGGSGQAAPLVDALRQGLRELGYIEDRNMVFTIRWGEADPQRLRNIADEFVRSRVDVIVAGPDPSITAATRATKTIPIVMCLATDPVGSRFITTLSRPGGNVTGLTLDISPEIHAKRLELLKETVPTISRLTVLGNPTSPARAAYARALDHAAGALRIAVIRIDARDAPELKTALQALTRQRPEAVLVESDPLVYSHRSQIVDLIARLQTPAVYGAIDWVGIGGLMAYGPSRADLMRRAAIYVDKILRGAKPADLPVEQPTKFELVINLKTAKSLGLTIPPSLLLRADEVIE